MSRHNRRRSRGGRKHATASRTAVSPLSDDGSASSLMMYSFGDLESDLSRNSSPSPVPDFVDRIPRLPLNMPMPRSTAPSARVWHNRYLAWQARKQQAEQVLSNDQHRGFGGLRSTALNVLGSDSDDDSGSDPDEDQELDVKMNDYFRGLDWLD